MSKWPDGVPFPKPVKPDSVAHWEWNLYMNMDPRTINPEVRDKVEKAMGWKRKDIDDAQEIAEKVGDIVANLDREAPPVLARLRAALRLLENEHITPQGRRIIEKILDEEEKR